MSSSNQFSLLYSLRVLSAVIMALLGLSPATFAASPKGGDVLTFFNNWFVTGDYATGGVGLKNTTGAGNITFTGVPCTSASAIVPCTTAGAIPAYPVAAFLYWQNVETGATPGDKGK